MCPLRFALMVAIPLESRLTCGFAIGEPLERVSEQWLESLSAPAGKAWRGVRRRSWCRRRTRCSHDATRAEQDVVRGQPETEDDSGQSERRRTPRSPVSPVNAGPGDTTAMMPMGRADSRWEVFGPLP